MKQVYLDINGDILNDIFDLEGESCVDKILQEIVNDNGGKKLSKKSKSKDTKDKKKDKDKKKKSTTKKSKKKESVKILMKMIQ